MPGLRCLLLILGLFSVGKITGQNYYLNGDATALANNCYSITPDLSWQNGTVWYAEQLNLNQTFSLEFTMNFGVVDANGADGMVFVLQTVGTNAIGLDGAGMGFQGFNPSFGIEFDTFSNPESNDPVSDHVAFLQNGVVDHNSSSNLAGPAQANATNFNIEDGQDHIVRITWEPISQMIELYVDCQLRLSDQINMINSIFGGNAIVYWGFTGATGYFYNPQTICLQDYYYGETSDSTICVGESMPLAAPGNPEGLFSWLPITGLDNPLSQTPISTPEITTEYCYTYTDLCNQTFSNCVTVYVDEVPLVNAGVDTSFCAGTNVGLAGEVSIPESVINWSTIEGNIVLGSDELNPTVNAPGTYTLTALSPNAGCSAEDEVYVSELSLPELIIDTPVQFCEGETFTLDAGVGWDQIIWYDGSNGETSVIDQSGDYDLTVTLAGCDNTVTFEAIEVELPTIDLGPDIFVCDGENVIIDAGVVGSWSNGEIASSITVQQPGEYVFLMIDMGCETSDEIEIFAVMPPLIELDDDLVFCQGDSIILNIPMNGSWSDGSYGDEFVVSASGDYSVTVVEGPCVVTEAVHAEVIESPEADLGDDMDYCIGSTVTLMVDEELASNYLWTTGDESSSIEIRNEGAYGITIVNFCGVDADTVNISFQDCDFSIYAPTTFTPNGDKLNDVWFVHTSNLTVTELVVYSRWGEVVFTTTEIQKPWIGDVMGGTHFAADGVYNYQLKYVTDKGDADEIRGHVLLLR